MVKRYVADVTIKRKAKNMDKWLMDDCKLKWHMDRIEEHYKHGKRIYPLHVDIGVAKLCNAKCVYCFGIQQRMTGEIIPREPLINLFKDAPRLGIKSITVTGDGENTLNPAIYDALIVGKKNGLDIGFATNGILLNNDQIKILLECCVWVRFNLSAIGKEGYKKIHGVDAWHKVELNIVNAAVLKTKIKIKTDIGLQMVLIPSALEYVISETQFAITNELSYFVIKQFSDPKNEQMSRFNLNWYDGGKTKTILKQAETMSNNKTQIIPKWGTMGNKGHKGYEHCPDCALIFQISGNSRCYPCGLLFNREEYCYGDLKKNSLKEILDSDRYWKIVKFMREKFDNKKECEGCACRHDKTNKFIWDYLHKPAHINFV